MAWHEGEAIEIATASPVGTVVLDADGQLLAANDAARALLGGRSDEEVAAVAGHGLPDDETWQLREVVRPDGTHLSVLVRRSALDGGRLLVSMVPAPAHLVDADRSTRSKTAFISALSHELRTPLNALLGFAQLLEMDALTAEQAESVEQILNGGRHLLSLISDTIDINRIEAGELPLRPEACQVGPLCEEVVALMSAEAARRGSRFEVLTPSRSPTVVVDRARTRQVLLNLVGNAVKYGGPGGLVSLQVSVSAHRCRIKVRDNGPGIDPRDADRVFEPFQRLAGAGSEVGTGLGLPLARSLAESMGGSLTLEGTSGHGCVFCLELPLAPHADRSVPRAWGVDGVVAGRVLHVEDNESNARLVERLVQRRPGVVLDQVATIAEARARLAERDFDAVLLDLALPDGRGDELIFGELAQRPATTVVVMSGDYPSGELAAALAERGHVYLQKPLDLGLFLQALDAAVTPSTAPARP